MLLGTASTWFLLDIAFYSQNLFLPNILDGIGYNPSIHLPAAKCGKDGTQCTVYDYPVCYLRLASLHHFLVPFNLHSHARAIFDVEITVLLRIA